MRKFLVVNMNYMGDALLTTPAIAALRQAYPEACIDTVVGAGAAAEVLQNNPDLDTIIARTARGSWARVMQTYRLLRDGRYTDAVILPPLSAYAAAAWLARTPRRVGQSGRGMNRFLTELRQTRATHMADAMLDTMPIPSAPGRAAGTPPRGRHRGLLTPKRRRMLSLPRRGSRLPAARAGRQCRRDPAAKALVRRVLCPDVGLDWRMCPASWSDRARKTSPWRRR